MVVAHVERPVRARNILNVEGFLMSRNDAVEDWALESDVKNVLDEGTPVASC